MTSHERCGVLNHCKFNCLLNRLFKLTTKSTFFNIKWYPCECDGLSISKRHFIRRIHQSLMDSPNKGTLMYYCPYKEPMIRKVFPCHDVIMLNTACSVITWSIFFRMLTTDAAYHQTSNISCMLADNKMVDDHSDVVGASPVGVAPNTSSFSTEHLTSMDWSKTTVRRDI